MSVGEQYIIIRLDIRYVVKDDLKVKKEKYWFLSFYLTPTEKG